jgi:hypothetical protein
LDVLIKNGLSLMEIDRANGISLEMDDNTPTEDAGDTSSKTNVMVDLNSNFFGSSVKVDTSVPAITIENAL